VSDVTASHHAYVIAYKSFSIASCAVDGNVFVNLAVVANYNSRCFTSIVVVLRLATDYRTATNGAVLTDGSVTEQVHMWTKLAAVTERNRRFYNAVRADFAAFADSSAGHDYGRGMDCGF
jgi:hypothetical protein